MEQNNKLHDAIRDTFGSAVNRLQGSREWADFLIDGNRITLTKSRKGFRIVTPDYISWKSSAKAACNFIAKSL